MNLDDIVETSLISELTGHIPAVEEAIILHNSLLILQNENHFRKVYFWGRIFGTDKDYYIAFGYTKDVLNDRVYYYSIDGLNWGLLPKPTKNGVMITPRCVARFQGDPALVLDVLIEKDETEFGDGDMHVPKVVRLKEEDRLAATVYLINAEAWIAPRGGLFRRPDGVIVENLAFEGLTAVEAREYKNYLHVRKPTRTWNTNLLTRDDYNFAIDFLDPTDMDIPEGCWVVQFGGGDAFVLLKALYWPGMYFWHYIDSPKYGFIYFGNGRKCLDVPFLLNMEEYKKLFKV